VFSRHFSWFNTLFQVRVFPANNDVDYTDNSMQMSNTKHIKQGASQAMLFATGMTAADMHKVQLYERKHIKSEI